MDRITLDTLIEELLPGKLETFNREVIDCMYDRFWCKKHGLDYSQVKYSDAREALYRDYHKEIILEASH